LADARQISDKVVFLLPAVQVILPLMDGTRTMDQIVAEVGRGLTRPILESIVAQLDDAFLIEGPGFESLYAKTKSEFDSLPVLPPAASLQFAEALAQQALGETATDAQKSAEGAKRVRETFDNWMKQALKGADTAGAGGLPRGVIVPHVDYGRGWPNYASVYGRMRGKGRPDRVVILGTNHFGVASGVCGCNKGYESPLGTCEADAELIGGLEQRLGPKLFENRYDHENEHSIELQIMWIQHVFGKDAQGNYPKVFGALVHDPSVNNGESYDGNGLAMQPFVEALKEVIAGLPGTTLVVSSADLSHAGPAFGDPHPLGGEEPQAKAARDKVVQHDREMLALISENKPLELVSSMAWQQNPTRWCSIGNIVATMLAVEGTKVELLNYVAAMDQQGMTLVSSAGALIH
jgi:AmmeMemoRadiSam system protein B